MARVKRGVTARRRHKRVLEMAKGYYGGKSRLFRTAKEAVDRALAFAYRDRKVKKRDFRKLWIARINAAVRLHGLSYSSFMGSLHKKDIKIDRRALAELAINDATGFAKLVETAKL
jgi:large subunit ribosomal protein L20